MVKRSNKKTDKVPVTGIKTGRGFSLLWMNNLPIHNIRVSIRIPKVWLVEGWDRSAECWCFTEYYAKDGLIFRTTVGALRRSIEEKIFNSNHQFQKYIKMIYRGNEIDDDESARFLKNKRVRVSIKAFDQDNTLETIYEEEEEEEEEEKRVEDENQNELEAEATDENKEEEKGEDKTDEVAALH